MDKIISEEKAKEMLKERLDETKEEWIKNYYGGDVLEEIDPIAFNEALSYFIDELIGEGYRVEGYNDEN